MTVSRPSADLTIPDAAIDAAHDLVDRAVGSDDPEVIYTADIRAIAAPVVAQFLRDLASQHLRVTGGFLAELADEIDGGERDE